ADIDSVNHHHIRVSYFGEASRLIEPSLDPDGGRRLIFTAQLERDLALERRVPGAIDLGEATFADLFEDLDLTPEEERLTRPRNRGFVHRLRLLPRRRTIGRRKRLQLAKAREGLREIRIAALQLVPVEGLTVGQPFGQAKQPF